MGSCSNKATETKNGIQEVIIKPQPPSKPENPLATVENHENPQIPNLVPRRRSDQLEKQHQGLKFFLKNSKEDETCEVPTAKISTPQKTQQDVEFIQSVLKKHFIFNSLTPSQFQSVVNQIKLFELGPNEQVFIQNKPGKYFFIIQKGTLLVKILGALVTTITAGMSFGEGALLQNIPRTASIQTLTSSSLWGMDRETFTKVVSEMNSAKYEENKTFIYNTEVFKELTNSQKEALIQELTLLYFNKNSTIIKQGEIGDLLYIVKEGYGKCIKDGIEVGQVVKGECFGEQALFFESPRTASIIAEVPMCCIGITSKSLVKIFGTKLQDLIYKNILRKAIKINQYLKKLSKVQEEILVSSMDLVTFEDSDLVIERGTIKISDLIIVIKGALSCGDRTVHYLECIGDAEIINNSQETWKIDVKACGRTIIACITFDQFESAIGGKYSESVGKNNKIKLLKHVPLLRNLTNDQLHEILKVIRVEEYGQDMNIFMQGDPGGSLFIIKSGNVDILKDDVYMRSVGKHDYFGERAILFSVPRTATARAVSRVVVFVLFRADFLRIVSDKIKYNLMKRMDLQDETIQLQDLKIVKLLGKGMTGIVFLAAHQKKKNLFALKTVHKQKIFEYDMYEGIKLERKILLQLDHTFIMKLVKTFKDSKRVYFLTEYVRGMDLFEVIRKMNFISEPQARFFVCSLVMVLENLHDKALVYRDLKPENVVVDDEGYLKVIDFGTAKFVHGKTYTVLGTPQYMAPEVILSEGYGYSADYWSLGIMMFEFLFGYVPFGELDNDPMIVYEKVLARKIAYPNIGDSIYLEAKSLIEQLLNKNAAMRDGGSIESLKSHSWFKGFEWDLLMSREMKTPYMPVVSRYEKEIEKALETGQDFDKIIENEESFKGLPEIDENPGWDNEF